MKRITAILLTALLLIGCTGCGSTANTPTAPQAAATAAPAAEAAPASGSDSAPAAVTTQEPTSAPTAVPTPEPTPVPTPTPTPDPGPVMQHIKLVNAQVNSHTELTLVGNDTFLARAVLPDENYTVDHWEINGKPVDSNGRTFSLEFSSEGTKTVMACLRQCLHVTGVDCYLQYLSAEGLPAGQKYAELYFEREYTVPTTARVHAGRSISVCATAEIPEGYFVDYWLVNDMPVGVDAQNVESILLIGLNETTKLQPVFGKGERTRIDQLIPDIGPEEHDDGPGMNISATVLHIHDYRIHQKDYNTHVYVCANTGVPGCELPEYTENHYFAVQALGDGTHRYTCTICGYSYTEGCRVGQYRDLGPDHGIVCSVCGYVYNRGPHYEGITIPELNGRREVRCGACNAFMREYWEIN